MLRPLHKADRMYKEQFIFAVNGGTLHVVYRRARWRTVKDGNPWAQSRDGWVFIG